MTSQGIDTSLNYLLSDPLHVYWSCPFQDSRVPGSFPTWRKNNYGKIPWLFGTTGKPERDCFDITKSEVKELTMISWKSNFMGSKELTHLSYSNCQALGCTFHYLEPPLCHCCDVIRWTISTTLKVLWWCTRLLRKTNNNGATWKGGSVSKCLTEPDFHPQNPQEKARHGDTHL